MWKEIKILGPNDNGLVLGNSKKIGVNIYSFKWFHFVVQCVRNTHCKLLVD